MIASPVTTNKNQFEGSKAKIRVCLYLVRFIQVDLRFLESSISKVLLEKLNQGSRLLFSLHRLFC
ncbi:hypothetical protein E1A91_D06G249700v1 [Gossypium mustelinum]|uniref:Uncharacterized protein n=1 Tax=Gossypium mustelinum TaxID=34275 RepID=A0A5D2UNA2_GOSMU|nr:hypothetical protein E1A91_D06G249700v1 [Gossypium mustelinum]